MATGPWPEGETRPRGSVRTYRSPWGALLSTGEEERGGEARNANQRAPRYARPQLADGMAIRAWGNALGELSPVAASAPSDASPCSSTPSTPRQDASLRLSPLRGVRRGSLWSDPSWDPRQRACVLLRSAPPAYLGLLVLFVGTVPPRWISPAAVHRSWCLAVVHHAVPCPAARAARTRVVARHRLAVPPTPRALRANRATAMDFTGADSPGRDGSSPHQLHPRPYWGGGSMVNLPGRCSRAKHPAAARPKRCRCC